MSDGAHNDYYFAKEAAMIDLTQKQVRAMAAQHPRPLEMVNPSSQEIFVLIPKQVYDLTCKMGGGRPGQIWDDRDDDLVQ